MAVRSKKKALLDANSVGGYKMPKEDIGKSPNERAMVSGFLYVVDTLNEWMGTVAAWLFLPLTLLIAYDVFLRYVLNAPTIWAWDVNVQLMGAFVALGGGYTLLHGGHVCVDILTSKMPTRRKGIFDATTSLLSIFGLAILFWRVSLYAWQAVITQEHFTSTWYPPIYPLKVIIALGILTMFLQAIATFIRHIKIVASGNAG